MRKATTLIATSLLISSSLKIQEMEKMQPQAPVPVIADEYVEENA